jgi:protein TonB
MSATTVNAFPPLHAFTSSRSWFIALIVLLHAGFFWALTHGVTIGDLKLEPPVIVDFLPDKTKPEPEPLKPKPPEGGMQADVDPVPLPPEIDYREKAAEGAPQADPRAEPVAGPGSNEPVPPIVVEPKSDPRYPFTEPAYPVSEIRMGHEGTVYLKVQVLPNGRVGAVQIERSSGFVKLDESAMREARTWRMKPGMHDGVATAMWTVVPIKFRLKN